MSKESKPRKLTVLRARGYEYSRRIPSITLSGLWLKEFGYHPGDKVCVEQAGDGKLIVTKTASAQ